MLTLACLTAIGATTTLRNKGVMAGYDQKSNVVLSDTKERVYSMEEGVEEIPLGLYLVKGDQMCVLLLLRPSVPNYSLQCAHRRAG